MQVDIEVLREKLETLTDDGSKYSWSDLFAVFDRACVLALGESTNGTKELTRGQRAAATRARNKKAAAENGGGEPVGE